MKKVKSEKLDNAFNLLFQMNRYAIYTFIYLIIRVIIIGGYDNLEELTFDYWLIFAAITIFPTLILRVIGYKMVYKEDYKLIIPLLVITAISVEIFRVL